MWDFSIAPMFYQTTWFAVVCVAAAIVAVAGIWHLHLRQVRQRFALLLGERARLSREIHDTLLQSLVGVALQLDVVANDLESSAPPIKEQFVRMRRNVEEYIREARQSIWNLRSLKLGCTDLAAALREAGEHATAGYPVAFRLTVKGTTRRCAAKVEEQLLRIGQEAILNAVRHAQPTEVCVELQYNDESVVLRVLDDGHGFNPEHVVAEADGHYGLVSMKERAEEIGGGFRISSSRRTRHRGRSRGAGLRARHRHAEMDSTEIRVLCVDDHRIVREGIALIIARQPDMTVVGSAATGEEAVALFERHRPDITLMDLQLGSMSGVEAIRAIRQPGRRRPHRRADDVSRRRGHLSGARSRRRDLSPERHPLRRSHSRRSRSARGPGAADQPDVQAPPRGAREPAATDAARGAGDRADFHGHAEQGNRGRARHQRGNGAGAREEHLGEARTCRTGPPR